MRDRVNIAGWAEHTKFFLVLYSRNNTGIRPYAFIKKTKKKQFLIDERRALFRTRLDAFPVSLVFNTPAVAPHAYHYLSSMELRFQNRLQRFIHVNLLPFAWNIVESNSFSITCHDIFREELVRTIYMSLQLVPQEGIN